jgi:hypothetical protein
MGQQNAEDLTASLAGELILHKDMTLRQLPEAIAADWQERATAKGLFLGPSEDITQVNVHTEVLYLSPKAQHELQVRANVVGKALAVAAEAIAADPVTFRALGIIPDPDDLDVSTREADAQQIMESNRATGLPLIQVGRLDMFPVVASDGSLTFQAIEANMRCVEGLGYTSILHDMTTEALGIDPSETCPPMADMVVAVAQDAHRARTGEATTDLHLGMVYWPNDAVKSVETPVVTTQAAAHHPEMVVAMGRPDELTAVEGADGKWDVYIRDERTGGEVQLDVVYRNIGVHDFTWTVDGQKVRADVLADIIANPSAYNCTVVPSARQGWAGYKSLFALISDPKYESIFLDGNIPPDDLQLARETVGWSRMLGDMVPSDMAMILEDPENYVIKHVSGAGGAEVVLGWSVESIQKAVTSFGGDAQRVADNPSAAWAWVLTRAHAAEGWLAQRKIAYLELPGGRVMDTNPYIVSGEARGQVVCRVGTKHPINVKQGGGLMPIVWRADHA